MSAFTFRVHRSMSCLNRLRMLSATGSSGSCSPARTMKGGRAPPGSKDTAAGSTRRTPRTPRLVRGRDKSRDTPIIFLTPRSRSETHVFRGYELGAVDYIFKPFEPEILRSKVNVFVELFRKTQALTRQAHELARLSKQNEL